MPLENLMPQANQGEAAARGRGQTRLSSWLRILATILILGLVVYQVGGYDVIRLLEKTDIFYAISALVVIEAQILVSAWRWMFTAHRLGLPLTYRSAVSEYYLTSLLNMVLPGGVAGDVVRATRVGLPVGGGTSLIGRGLRSVVIERLAGQIAYTLVALIGFAVAVSASMDLPISAGVILAFFAIGLVLLVIAVALLARHGPERLQRLLADLGPDLRRAFTGGIAPWFQSATSLGLVTSYIGVFALCGAAIGAPLPFLAVVGLVPLVLLAMLLPITVGGFGVREGAAAALWPIVGLSASAGIATGTLYGLLLIIGALPGVYVLWRRRA
jgi:glycosyltransferase 2 family protein